MTTRATHSPKHVRFDFAAGAYSIPLGIDRLCIKHHRRLKRHHRKLEKHRERLSLNGKMLLQNGMALYRNLLEHRQKAL